MWTNAIRSRIRDQIGKNGCDAIRDDDRGTGGHAKRPGPKWGLENLLQTFGPLDPWLNI